MVALRIFRSSFHSNLINKTKEAGGVIAEFAIVVPVLIIFAIGIIQLGQALSQYPTLLNTSYLLAQYMAPNRSMTQPEVNAWAEKLMNHHETTGENNFLTSFEISGTPDSSGSRVNVDASASLSSLWQPAGQTGIGLQLPINVSVVGPLYSDKSVTEYDDLPSATTYGCSCSKGSPSDFECNNPCLGAAALPDPVGNPYIPPPTTGGSCFLAGTLISMADGSKQPIEQLKLNDQVLAFDEASKSLAKGLVVHTFVHKDIQGYYILNQHLRVTANHPMYVDGEWRRVDELKLGDHLTSSDGKTIALNSIEHSDDVVTVYNIEVDSQHTYIANGLIVHNKNILPGTSVSNNNGFTSY